MRLLVCDDDPAVGKLFESIYSGEGSEVDVVTSGQACIAKVTAESPDVLVLDHMMPEMTGIDTARVLRLQGFAKPIVLFSAYLAPEVDDAARALDLLPVSKVDTQAVIRIIDVLAGNPHLRAKAPT